MPPPATVEYALTPDVTARAAEVFVRVRRDALNRNFRKVLAGLLTYIGVTAALLFVTWFTLGVEKWFLWAMGGMVGLAVGLVVLLVGLHGLALFGLRTAARRGLRAAGEDYTAAPAPTVRWTFTDDGFETRLNGQTRGVSWTAVRSFAAADEFWIIGVRKGPDLFLPLAVVPDDVRELVRGKLGAPGGAEPGA